ncbi:jg16288 [Pararge aegeria aegeria]|uniref:Jg16288 protein n=1 Tax=Pararge aegeria aegeria TaxID=348720 RepID=A0A8S4RW60_9NEOP|nr:jg16288 [Pararge aegeria aegeria]
MMKRRNIVAQFNSLNNFIAEFEPFSSSPPAPEDSFFYIRYPKTDVLFGKPKFAKDFQSEQQTEATYSVIKDKDWSKHTKPCQDVLHGIIPINTAVKSVKPKPAGIDDGFKGEGAACGSSVVRMVSRKRSNTSLVMQQASPTKYRTVSNNPRRKVGVTSLG